MQADTWTQVPLSPVPYLRGRQTRSYYSLNKIEKQGKNCYDITPSFYAYGPFALSDAIQVDR